MKKIGLSIISLAGVFALTSCDVFSAKVWSWDKSTVNDTINYCLLIGQLDHNDSMYRTKGVRDALGTRPDEPYQKANFNLEEPKKGHITLTGGFKDPEKGEGSVGPKDFDVIEIEHAEQKSLAGTTWDPITANNSAATWIAKHGKNITLFASNNDGMAEGAYMAPNWYKNMPIFGYDANASTLRLIKDGEIQGTIDSNTPTQCAVSSLLIRNIIDATEKKYDESGDPGTTYSRVDLMYKKGMDPEEVFDDIDPGYKYNPVLEGFDDEQPETDYGYLSVKVDTSTCDFEDENSLNAVLVNNEAITGDWDIGNLQEGPDPTKERFGVNVRDYFNGDKMKEKKEIAETKEGKLHAPTVGQHRLIEVCQTYYSSSDVYFTGNMQPYFDIFQPMFGFNMDKIHRLKGDGTEEAKLINAVDSLGACDAYLINVVKQPNAHEYISHIASKLGLEKDGYDDWIDRSDVPIIFWNRQPTNDQGEVSTDVMNNRYFKYTYYVGFGAEAGGEIQGDMIAEWLNEAYIQNA